MYDSMLKNMLFQHLQSRVAILVLGTLVGGLSLLTYPAFLHARSDSTADHKDELNRIHTEYCQELSDMIARRVSDARSDGLSQIPRRSDIQPPNYSTIGGRLVARGNTHIKSPLSERLVRADLYGLCMSLK